jgi:tRNA pseudouridine38-40 synthase
MPRYRLDIEYDGGPFVGWQRQENGLAVQAVLEEAVFAFCGERATVHGAGRTDAGVHALGQVAHLDLERDWPVETVRDALNAHLRPHPVAVLNAAPAADDFHARFSAVGRVYRYRIVNRKAPLTVEAGRAWWVPRPLDHRAMHTGAQELLGKHDFSSFRAAGCQARSPVKTLDALDVRRDGEAIAVHAAARSFLHQQVRILVGSLALVGEGKWSAADLAAALAARDRAAAGPTAPAAGLYLVAVRYPDEVMVA